MYKLRKVTKNSEKIPKKFRKNSEKFRKIPKKSKKMLNFGKIKSRKSRILNPAGFNPAIDCGIPRDPAGSRGIPRDLVNYS